MLATREGYRSIEHVKRYTTTGMGTDQGKTSNVAALAIVAQALGGEAQAVRTPTFPAPYPPTTNGADGGSAVGLPFAPLRNHAQEYRPRRAGAQDEDRTG